MSDHSCRHCERLIETSLSGKPHSYLTGEASRINHTLQPRSFYCRMPGMKTRRMTEKDMQEAAPRWCPKREDFIRRFAEEKERQEGNGR